MKARSIRARIRPHTVTGSRFPALGPARGAGRYADRALGAGAPVSIVLASARLRPAVVIDANDRPVGELPRGSVERAAATDPSTDAVSIAVPFPAVVGTEVALDEALDLLASPTLCSKQFALPRSW
ncbi:MAG: hypothetical protein ABIP13_04445 [Tepidiformaceae bacterium]